MIMNDNFFSKPSRKSSEVPGGGLGCVDGSAGPWSRCEGAADSVRRGHARPSVSSGPHSPDLPQAPQMTFGKVWKKKLSFMITKKRSRESRGSQELPWRRHSIFYFKKTIGNSTSLRSGNICSEPKPSKILQQYTLGVGFQM